MIYADDSFTTKISDVAIKIMVKHIQENYGNLSSLYNFGRQAKEVLETAGDDVAKIIDARQENVYFTSGGSEVDNQAILSVTELGKK